MCPVQTVTHVSGRSQFIGLLSADCPPRVRPRKSDAVPSLLTFAGKALEVRGVTKFGVLRSG
jgi:hypothetical protein